MIIDTTLTAIAKQLDDSRGTLVLYCKKCQTMNYLPLTGGTNGEHDCCKCGKAFAVITYLEDSVCAYLLDSGKSDDN